MIRNNTLKTKIRKARMNQGALQQANHLKKGTRLRVKVEDKNLPLPSHYIIESLDVTFKEIVFLMSPSSTASRHNVVRKFGTP